MEVSNTSLTRKTYNTFLRSIERHARIFAPRYQKRPEALCRPMTKAFECVFKCRDQLVHVIFCFEFIIILKYLNLAREFVNRYSFFY